MLACGFDSQECFRASAGAKIFSRRFASSIVSISVVESGNGPSAYTPGSLPRN